MLLAIIIGVFVVGYLAFLAYMNVPQAPARISEPAAAYDRQYDVFRDMEPSSQTREGAWVGFLQENVHGGRTGPIGDFIGNDSDSGNAVLYAFQEGYVGKAIDPNSCDGCKCMDDAPAAGDKSTDSKFRALFFRDNKTVCARVRDGVRYACKPTCCTPACA